MLLSNMLLRFAPEPLTVKWQTVCSPGAEKRLEKQIFSDCCMAQPAALSLGYVPIAINCVFVLPGDVWL